MDMGINVQANVLIIIIINHLFHFSTIHGSSSKIKTYGS